MTTGSDERHVMLGAYVLGGLSDEEHSAFSEHLRTCGRCQAELGQVSGLPRLLDLAAPEGGPFLTGAVGGDAAPRERATEEENVVRLLDEVGRRRRHRRHWLSAVAAAVAAVLFAGGAWLGPQLFSSSPPAPPTTHVAAAPVAGSGVRVDLALVTRGWGTQIDIDCEDMPTQGELALWVVDRSGRAVTAASWHATPGGYSRVTGATALPPSQIRSLEVRTDTGQVLASART